MLTSRLNGWQRWTGTDQLLAVHAPHRPPSRNATRLCQKWIKTAATEGWINVGRVQGLRNRYYATVPKPLSGLLPDDAAPTKRPKPEKKVESPKQKCWACGATSLRPKMYMGTNTGILECSQCGSANEPDPPPRDS